mgnify:CR=1 FL=1
MWFSLGAEPNILDISIVVKKIQQWKLWHL